MYSIRKYQKQTQTVIPAKNRRAASALVEMMLAVAILIIALLTTSTTYVAGKRQIADQKQYQAAAQLASQKLEEVRAAGYFGITEGLEEEEIFAHGLACKRNSVIELTGNPAAEVPYHCKKVTVTIIWEGSAREPRQAKFVTYVEP